MNLGIFSGLWGGISNTLGQGAAEISEYTGSADKKRAFDYAMQQQALSAQSNNTRNIIIGVVFVVIVLVIIFKR